jgi:hypothetical protein
MVPLAQALTSEGLVSTETFLGALISLLGRGQPRVKEGAIKMPGMKIFGQAEVTPRSATEMFSATRAKSRFTRVQRYYTTRGKSADTLHRQYGLDRRTERNYALQKITTPLHWLGIRVIRAF